ncbi:MAG: hypothetical protein COA78_04020 [Blastopirellula sp.]|nr:MAG: hypothetical protein COA78_04020 [Blastopirellula sp.]
MYNSNSFLQQCSKEFEDEVFTCSENFQENFDFERDFRILRDMLDCDSITANEIIGIAGDLLACIEKGRQFLIPWLESAGEDASYLPPVRGYQKKAISSLSLFNHEKLQISLNCFDANLLRKNDKESSSIDTVVLNGQTTISRFIKTGNCNLEIWKCSKLNEQECKKLESKYIQDGYVLIQDGNVETFSIDKAESSIVILQAQVMPNQSSLIREYEKSSGSLVSQSNGSLKSSRIQMYSTLLRLFGRLDSFKILERYVSHEDAQVRWHVMRELIALDTSASLPSLNKMASLDSDEAVRNAAEETRQLIEFRFANKELDYVY